MNYHFKSKAKELHIDQVWIDKSRPVKCTMQKDTIKMQKVVLMRDSSKCAKSVDRYAVI